MNVHAPVPHPPLLTSMRDIFRPSRTEAEAAARPSDGLTVFSVMWAMAMVLSAASHLYILNGKSGLLLACVTWSVIAAAMLVAMNPRKTGLLLALAVLMSLLYALRLPVSSNNQTIALFMNGGIIAAFVLQAARGGTWNARDIPYEQLRVIARGLLAVMYFYGIFHKINTGFLDPQVSCATALYQPLARPFGLENNLFGQYAAIYATFIVEAIAIVCLYWRRFFWVGLLVSLPFHYFIPISGYSWYLDFSSLVFALYMLSVPREVAAGLYATGVALLRRPFELRAGPSFLLHIAAFWGVAAAAIVVAAYLFYPDRGEALWWHSAWLLVWTAFGGLAMILIIRAALLELPYRTPRETTRQSLWVYAIPAVLFLASASPYVGLKTESSIAMFSNLHTEGGVTNHLLFDKPPYLFPYQEKVVRIIDTSSPELKARSQAPGFGLVEHDLALRLRGEPGMWVTYEVGGQRFERVTDATFAGHRPNLIERKLLDFKPVDWSRPKVCSH